LFFDRSLPTGLRIFVVCVCFAITGMYAVTTWHARDVAVDSARRESANLAESLTQQASDTVEIAEGALAEIVGRSEMEGISPEARVLLTEDMAQAVVAMPRLHMLLIVDEHGHLLLDATSSASREDLNFSDSEFFKYHRAVPSRGVFVSGPILSKTDNTWVMAVTRRIDHSDGRFAGVVVAQIALDYFAQTYAGMDIGASGVILLVRENGTILARQPAQQAFVGRTLTNSRLFSAPLRDASSGIYITRSPLDGVQRVYAFRRLERAQITLLVGLSEHDFLTHWRADAIRNAIATLVIVTMIAGLGTFLIKQIEKRRKAEDSLSRLAMLDGLTGIANRRQLDDVLEREWLRAIRDGKPIAALMIDVDHFKDYNDRYGHAQGDDALRSVAATIASNIRPTDVVARYGGEEFAVILPATDPHRAVAIAERVRLALVQQNIPHTGTVQDSVTVSIGIAGLVPTRVGLQSSLIEAADSALYDAKRLGRNRSVEAEQKTLPSSSAQT
jgi:diguanylate cyclase (GGDEF)-like protein